MWLAVLKVLATAYELARTVPFWAYTGLLGLAFGFVAGCRGCN